MLLPWLLVGSDLTGRAAEAPSDEPGRSLASGERVAEAAPPAGGVGPEATPGSGTAGGRAAQHRLQHDPIGLHGGGAGNSDPSLALQDGRLQPSSAAAPDVEVRVGVHGDFERVVFEWPEPIEYDVVQHAQEVAIAFARAGKIDLLKLREGFGGRMVEARADGGDTSRQVVLGVLPGVTIRSFSLENDRVVVIDLLGEPAPHRAAGAIEQDAAHIGLPAIGTDALLGADHARVQPTGDAAPDVEVRVGDHGDYERIVFEWPERIEYDVAQHGEQVTVAFSRAGRIDFSRVRDRLGGRMLEARTVPGAATQRVVLRVLPDATIRSFSLENDRVVVVDVFGESPQQRVVRHAPDPAQDPIRELRRELEQRDAVIDSLLARVEQLERDVVLSGGDLDRVVAGRAPSAADPSAADPSLPQPGARAVAAAEQSPGKPASDQEATTAAEGQSAASTTAQAQPGQFEVDEEEIDRALERTLVQAGVLLLPLGQAEVEPFFSYTRQESDASMVVFADNGLSVGAEVDVRRNEFVSGQTLRFGMPFDSQVEFGFPYRFVDQSMVATVDAGGSDEIDNSGHGMGDMSIGVAKTLVRENGHWWPDLIGRITWDTDTGETSSNDVALGGGFNELRGSLSAVKRQDPLAFVGGVSYETTVEKNDVQPGDQLGFSIGTVLAASPGTSLRLGLDQRFIDNAKIDGEGVNGSDFVIGTATFGASVVLGRGVLLDVAADIGLTDDAPDYAARASLPIRFNLPVY